LHGVFHRRGLERAAHGAPGLGSRNKSRVAQHIEMLHDGGQRHPERLRKFADRKTIFVAQSRQESAAGRIRKRRKNMV